MRRSKALSRLRNHESVRLCCLGHYIPAFVKHAAHYGYDAIWLDLEHRLIDDREVQALLAYAHLADIDIMLRPPTLEKTRLYRYLEDGAAGLMIPHVSTPEKARLLVEAVKFPPVGDRGIDGAGLDCDFIHSGGPTYPAEANAETFLVVQIETVEAVANADAIAAVEGVDAMFVGPGDLGLRLRHQAGDLTLQQAYETVAAAARKHGKSWGCPALSPEDLKVKHAMGARLINHGGEFGAIMKMLQSSVADYDGLSDPN